MKTLLIASSLSITLISPVLANPSGRRPVKCKKFLGLIAHSCKIIKDTPTDKTQSSNSDKKSNFRGRRVQLRIDRESCNLQGGKFDRSRKVCILK